MTAERWGRKGGPSDQETMGDGRQVRAPNNARFSVSVLCCHSLVKNVGVRVILEKDLVWFSERK